MNETIQQSDDKKDQAKALIFDEVNNTNFQFEFINQNCLLNFIQNSQMKKLEQKSNEKSKTLLSNITNQNSKPESAAPAKVESLEWTDEEVKLLVKGAQVIPMGTRDRWDVIANFIKEHSRGKFVRTGKEVLTKTKDIQRLDPTCKDEANKKAFEKTLQNKKSDVEVKDNPSERHTSNTKK
jgi:hypothetical protein